MSAAPSIIERMDLALERARFRYPESAPQWFYLTTEDWDAFNTIKSEEWGSPVYCFSHRDVQFRKGERSRLTLKGGCLVDIPKRLSPRTGAA